MKPLCIDLFSGLGGWTDGFLAEGWRCVGFDIERHVYGDHRYPADLVLQDVRTIHGKQFKRADMIVASSPCQEFSYRAMPWKRAKALPPPYFGMELFAQAKRIQQEACEAAGRYIPMIQENVRGAQKWVGKADWHFGSYYLWGDVPALMPLASGGVKVGGFSWSDFGKDGYVPVGFNMSAVKAGKANEDHTKMQRIGGGRKVGGDWVSDPLSPSRTSGSKSPARKAAAARIAKIPYPLASYIARTFYPSPDSQGAEG